MYSDRRENGQNLPGQNLPHKIQKPPDKNPSGQLRENLYRGLLSGIFVLGLLKIGGESEMCDVLLGVPGCVTKCDKGGQNWPKIVWRTLWIRTRCLVYCNGCEVTQLC